MASVALRGARATTRAQWHITVQFLGDDADIDAVSPAFAREPLDLDAGSVAFGSADALGDRRRAHIFALGLRDGGAWMRALTAQVEHRLAPLGDARDARLQFVPHLTLARFREPTDLRALRSAFGPEPVGPAWRVDEVVLYESVLDPEGARHTARARFSV